MNLPELGVGLTWFTGLEPVAEANAALIKAVTDQGLSIDEYTKIIEVAQSDPGVRDKLLQRLK